MQEIWARLLAGEANSPGRFSRRTVNLLSDFDKSDAELFTRFCGFGWWYNATPMPLIFNVDGEIYDHRGINFNAVTHLENIGLVQFDSLQGFVMRKLPKRVSVSYFGQSVEITLPGDSDNSLQIGNVIPTQAGAELASVCEAKPVDGFFDFVYDKWAAISLVPKRQTEQGVPADADESRR